MNTAPTGDTGRAADQAAGWEDILVRDNFQDAGQTPTADPIWQSPDIIPHGGDLMDFDEAESTYNGPDVGLRHPIVYGEQNLIHLRGRNLRTACPSSGDVRLYYARGGLVLDPRAWNTIRAANGSEAVPFVTRGGSREIPPGRICLSRFPFVWPPEVPVGHHCLIATCDTPSHPVAPGVPTFPSNAEYVNWVRYNPNIAWRNIDVVPCEQETYRFAELALCNFGSEWTKYTFGISGTNLPDGVATVSSADAQFPFVLPPVQIYAPGDEVYTRSILLPPDYCGTVTVNVGFARPLPCDAQIVLRAYNPVTGAAGTLEHRLSTILTPARDTAAAGRFILLGEYTFATPPENAAATTT